MTVAPAAPARLQAVQFKPYKVESDRRPKYRERRLWDDVDLAAGLEPDERRGKGAGYERIGAGEKQRAPGPPC